MKLNNLIYLPLTVFFVASCAQSPNRLTSKKTGGVPAPTVVELEAIPVGRPDPQHRKNMYISPYRPYKLIDCIGYKSGDVVGDPSTAKRNPKTGKIIESTAKYFRIP